MNCKAKGTAREHRSMRLLEASGYQCVRAAASLGVWDIVGIGSTDIVLCQVKSRDWPCLTDIETMKDFPAPDNCRRLIHRWRDHQRLPDVREL